MVIKFGYRCINCGDTFDDSVGVESHIVSNPSHVVVEQYYDTTSLPDSFAINNGVLNISDEGSLVVDDGSVVLTKNSNAYININYKNKKNRAPTSWTTVLTLNFKNIYNIKYIELISNISKDYWSSNAYDVRFYCVDIRKNLKLISGLSNNDKEVIMISDPDNIESDECIVEVQVRTNNRRCELNIYEMNVVYK